MDSACLYDWWRLERNERKSDRNASIKKKKKRNRKKKKLGWFAKHLLGQLFLFLFFRINKQLNTQNTQKLLSSLCHITIKKQKMPPKRGSKRELCFMEHACNACHHLWMNVTVFIFDYASFLGPSVMMNICKIYE